MKNVSIKIKEYDYKIYCLYHNKVYPKYYGDQIDRVTFVKMDKESYVFPAKNHIYLAKEKWFCPIGKEWAEYEFYYSLYKGYLAGQVELPEYLGFIHYDMEFRSKEKKYSGMTVIDFIEELIKKGKLNRAILVSFNPESFISIYKQNLNIFYTSGERAVYQNCIDFFISHYNHLEKRSLKKKDLDDKNISICGSFFIHRSVFLKMMGFLSKIIESHILEGYNKNKRTQGTFAERYVAIFLEELRLDKIEFPLHHYFVASSGLRFDKNFFAKTNKIAGLIGKKIKYNFPREYNKLKRWLK